MTERCINCGKFFPYSEMEEEGGASFFFEPLNEFGPERAEWTCAECNRAFPHNLKGAGASANNAPGHIR